MRQTHLNVHLQKIHLKMENDEKTKEELKDTGESLIKGQQKESGYIQQDEILFISVGEDPLLNPMGPPHK